MKVAVKICGLTRQDDIKTVSDAGADAVGFVFYPKSPRYINSVTAKCLIDDLPPFVQTVGLFVNADPAYVRHVLQEVPLSLLQFHGDESPEYCASFNRPYIKAIRVSAHTDLTAEIRRFNTARGILMDADAPCFGGSGKTFDWSLVQQRHRKLILAGGLTPDNVGQAIHLVRPAAVDVSSGVEVSPGIKSPEKIKAFIHAVHHATAVT